MFVGESVDDRRASPRTRRENALLHPPPAAVGRSRRAVAAERLAPGALNSDESRNAMISVEQEKHRNGQRSQRKRGNDEEKEARAHMEAASGSTTRDLEDRRCSRPSSFFIGNTGELC